LVFLKTEFKEIAMEVFIEKKPIFRKKKLTDQTLIPARKNKDEGRCPFTQTIPMMPSTGSVLGFQVTK